MSRASRNGGTRSHPSGSKISAPRLPHDPPAKKDLRKTLVMALGALGVVYGDIGTSPLYAVKECFHGLHGIAVTHANILGVMSLIFWSLTMVVTVKYVTFILKADNDGEGGIYALAALFLGKGGKQVITMVNDQKIRDITPRMLARVIAMACKP